MSILDYIEKIKRENEGPRITTQEPRNMADGGRIGFKYGTSAFDIHTKKEAAFKAYKDYKKSYYSGRQKYPIITFREFLPIYAEENFADGGEVGQLVQNTADGSRPGYQGPEKYITPARRSGAEGFQGQKFYQVDDPTYSDGRRRIKTKEYKAWLDEQKAISKKRPNRYSKGFIRREAGLLRIAEAFQKADITDDFEHLMVNPKDQKKFEKYHKRKMKTYKKGMLQAGDIVYINNLEKNFDDVIFIADQLGESPDWVLDKLDERTEFRDFARTEKDVLKKDIKYTKPRNDYLKVENWVQKNAKKYSTPESFEKALRKRFGNKNQFIVDMGSNKTVTKTYFSDGFKKMMLNADPGSGIKPYHLKQFIKSSLYNFNPKIKAKVTEELKGIFNAENLPKLRTEARKMIRNNPTLKMFGMDKGITGPFPKVIQAEIGKDLWTDLKNFRHPRVGTAEMLRAFSDLVPPEFKPMFQETIKAINYSKNNQWQKAKDTFGIADNIAWDHKVPSSVIDKGYADIVEYTKVNPTTEHFNERIKNAEFDSKINKLITKYEGVNTLDQKVKVVEKMNKVKSNFNEKYGNYLGEVDIKLDEKGNLRFSSTGKPLTTKMDRVKMLQTSLQQEKGIVPKNWNKVINNSKAKITAKALESAGVTDICSDQLVASGGRIGFAKKVCGTKFAEQNPDGFMKKAADHKEAAKLFKSGNMAKHLMKAKNWAKSNMGPAGWIGGELLIVGLGSVWDMSQGKGWKEAMDNWTGLGGHFGQAEKRLKEIGVEQGYSEQEINDAMKIGQLMDVSTEWEGKQWKLDQVQEQQDIGGTARYKSDPGKRFIGEKGYVRGTYQDPRSVRELRAEVPKLWEEGTELYESLKDYDSSVGLYDELQQKKAKEEYDKKMKLRNMPRHFAQQFGIGAAPEFEPWTPEYAGGGMVGIRKPSALPPTGGPQSGGLPSLYNNVRKR